MRALLLYNPSATTTTSAVTDVIARALSAELKLDVEATKRRNHAGYLAAGAVHEGYEAVVVLGGDGTVNEVVQGLAGTPVRLAIIPGGSTNVLARTLGLPNDAVEATSVILRKLLERSERVINLGVANGRYFTFNAGFGYDAATVREVERRYRLKQTVRQASFVWCGLLAHAYGFERRSAHITATLPGQEPVTGLRTVVCCNSDPYTYLGPKAARLCPDATFDGALELVGLRRIGLFTLLRVAYTALAESRDVRALRSLHTWSDVTEIQLTNDTPLPWQVDGDYVDETDRVSLRLVPRALTIIA